MNNLFPVYRTSFQSEYPAHLLTEKIMSIAAFSGNNLQVINSCSIQKKITLRSISGSALYTNSFLPIVRIKICESGAESLLFLTFELYPSTKIILTILSVFAAIFETILIVFWLQHQLSATSLLFLPVVMILFLFCLATIGLKQASISVLKILFSATKPNSEDRLPSINRY